MFLLSAVSGISSVLGPLQNRLPSRKFLRDFLYKNTPRESVLQRSKNARNFGNGRQQKYPNLDFDRNWLNTGIRLLAAVPSNLNNPTKSGHFWSYFLGITYVTIFSGLCPHSSLKGGEPTPGTEYFTWQTLTRYRILYLAVLLNLLFKNIAK